MFEKMKGEVISTFESKLSGQNHKIYQLESQAASVVKTNNIVVTAVFRSMVSKVTATKKMKT